MNTFKKTETNVKINKLKTQNIKYAAYKGAVCFKPSNTANDSFSIICLPLNLFTLMV
jgi:hypothetical protein